MVKFDYDKKYEKYLDVDLLKQTDKAYLIRLAQRDSIWYRNRSLMHR